MSHNPQHEVAAVEVVDEAAQFFAPVSADMVDGLMGRYRKERALLAQVAEFWRGPCATVLGYFVDGNATEDRGRVTLTKSAQQLFDEDGAVASLNASYWQQAINMTDVFDLMPAKRREEWREQISSNTCPAFEEETVRSTLTQLLNMRNQFFGERVDGIFRGLSGQHVTNAPEAFGKRMIIAHVLDEHHYSDHRRTGLISDLRSVVAKFMGRDEPRHNSSTALVEAMKANWGQWVSIDGGSIRIRVYKKGTAHLEVHPDMAWRLNACLAALYPMAIPAQFRQRPVRKAAEVPLTTRLLPFRVLEVIADMKPARQKVAGAWPERYETVPNAWQMPYLGTGKEYVREEVHEVLRAVGAECSGNGWAVFDYDAAEVLEQIVLTGSIPDERAHQFYPTPQGLAARVAQAAEIGPEHEVLEPSAGQGGLAAFLPKDRTTTVEVSALNCKVLRAKGYQPHEADFLVWSEALTVQQAFDRVVMNPPFSKGRALAHVEAAARCVRPGGRLVAILPSGADRSSILPGWNLAWSERLDNKFPGVSVSVVILTADRPL